MADIKSQIFKGVKWSAICRFYTSFVSVLQVAILARLLSKEDFGLMGIAILVNSFCGIFVDMGLTAAAMHEPDLTKQKFSSYYWFNIFAGFCLSLLVCLCSPYVARFYGNDELIGIISLTSLIIFINSFFSLQKTLQQKKMCFGYISVIDIISATIVLVLNVVFALKGFGVYSLVWSSLIGASVTALAYLWIAFIKEKNVLFYFNFKEVKTALKIGIYQVGSSTLDFISTEMDSLIISSYMSLEIFGIYTLFKNLTRRIYDVVNPIITNVFTPVLAKIQDDRGKVTKTYIRIVETLGFINFPLYSIIAFASFSLISILYGDTYCSYSFVLMCMSYFYAFQSCGNPVGALLVALGRTDRGFYWTIYRIIFTALYLYGASHFSLEVFSLLVFLIPQLMAFPAWWIMYRAVTDLSFVESYLLPMKPFLVSLLLCPLYYLDRVINMPIVGLPVIALLFIIGYICVNLIFRRKLTLENFGILKDFLKF